MNHDKAKAASIKMDYAAHEAVGALKALREAGKLEGLTVALGIIDKWDQAKATFEAAVEEEIKA